MKKRTLRRLLMLCFLSAAVFLSGTAVNATDVNLNDASLYKVKNYKSGDCLLCANAYMIKRMAMLMESDSYKVISNEALREAATADGVNTLNSSYTYTADGIEYTVTRGDLNGTAADKCRQVREMLKEHPEGIVVWGGSSSASYSGPHGVLITGYNPDKRYFYAADSARNYNGSNTGITSWAGTTMFSIRYCSAYYIISSVRLTDAAKIDSIKKTDDGRITLNWKDIGGQNRYQISKAKSASGKLVTKTLNSDRATSVSVQTDEGTAYYYRLRGVNRIEYVDWNGVSHEKVVFGDWSAAKKYRLE